MKFILPAILVFICHLTTWASELSLNRADKPVPAAVTPGSSPVPTDERIHLGLDRHEQNDTPVFAFSTPAIPTTASTNEMAVASPRLAGNPVASDKMSTLTMNAPAPAASVAALDLPSASRTVSNPGLSDSWVYLGLGILFLGVVWLCLSGKSHRQPQPINYGGGERRSRRAGRVKMVALKTER